MSEITGTCSVSMVCEKIKDEKCTHCDFLGATTYTMPDA